MAVARATTHGVSRCRPSVRGKFLFLGDRKLYVRGVTYGPFRPAPNGSCFADPEVVERDFARIAANGLNAVRVYEVPPGWLLDAAHFHGLLVMVGLAWEQHVAFLDDPKLARSIESRVRAQVAACAGHPAVLCYAIGNEIPAAIVRWQGRRPVERFLERLYVAAKEEDEGGLVTYVNYPSTEYLQLPFLDFECFNVYLESPRQLEAYVARLQNIAGDRPLTLAEVGLDSRRHGELVQARSLDWQIRTAVAGACAGAFVFAWTDEWHRGGFDIDDWDFGLTDRQRRPKPALAAVRAAFTELPFKRGAEWPRISVIVCSHNGERTLPDCFDGLLELDYPDYEVIVVDDGSSDRTAAIAMSYGFNVISTDRSGLASARNSGLRAATGEIVAYTDDDARPDIHWLTYLAATFRETGHAGVGGPNVAPKDDGLVATCVASAPGGPIHVLLSDREAEHIPGCNMAFRKDCLEAVGGFDPRFVAAGDDVDICWRLQRAGWTLGFSPGAAVMHRRRSSLRAYLRQQRGYGKAEALLERKWPEKYNLGGHLTWAGRVYGTGATRPLGRRWRIYYGTWGSGLFQSLEQAAPSVLASVLVTPETYLLAVALAALSLLGLLWAPLLVLLVPLALLAGVLIGQAGLSAWKATSAIVGSSRRQRLEFWALTALMHLLQPAARLHGRLTHGLTPWRWRGSAQLVPPRQRTFALWFELWRSPQDRLRAIEATLPERVALLRGGDYDRWDLEVRGGMLGRVRLRMVNEEHGSGHQLIRLRTWPRPSALAVGLLAFFGFLSFAAWLAGPLSASATLTALGAAGAVRLVWECAAAAGVLAAAVQELGRTPGDFGVELGNEPRVAKRAVAAFGEPGRAGSDIEADESRVSLPESSVRPRRAPAEQQD